MKHGLAGVSEVISKDISREIVKHIVTGIAAASVALSVAGCAVSQPARKSVPASPPPPANEAPADEAPAEPAPDVSSKSMHIEDALEEVDLAEAHIGRMLAPDAGRAMLPEDGELASPCESACRALASMASAAEHVCVLAGERDPRCGTARERVARATDRVRTTCGGCENGKIQASLGRRPTVELLRAEPL